jgi:type II secretory pathway component PulF
MPFFEYRAVSGAGDSVCGARRGETAEDVRLELSAEGLRATSIRRRDDPGAGGLFRRGVTAEDLALLHRQTANLLATGLPLPRALRAVARESGKRALERLADAIASDVEKGRPLSDALRDHARVVPPFVADLVKAGESAGSLPAVLLDIAAGAESEARIRRSLRLALAYPVTVAVIALLVVLLNSTGIVSRYFFPETLTSGAYADQLFNEFQDTVSSSRRGSSVTFAFLHIIGHPVLWTMILGGFLLLAFFSTSILVLRGDRIGIPVFGRLVRQVLVSRFCRVLALLVDRQVPLPAALRLAGAASDSRTLADNAEAAATDVESGHPLGDAVDSLVTLPAATRWGIGAAAARGALSAELAVLAHQADERAADIVRSGTIILETSLILLIGLFVLVGAGTSVVRLMAYILSLIQSMA